MPAVQVTHIIKKFGDRVGVDDLSFTVEPGEVFGLIGPNGAGKTSTIRMMMDILEPDSGEILVFGEELSEASKNRLGYLPEDRGLYKKLSVIDSIVYLAALKGVNGRIARARAEALLERTGMASQKLKRIDQLSKGMGQIVQLIVTVLHDPELVILDEPFSGLDPVNTELMKRMITELRGRGAAVILSTHQMNQVEELCDGVLMINEGRDVLHGDLDKIKAEHRSNSVLVAVDGELGSIRGVAEMRSQKGCIELVLDGTTSPRQILGRMVDSGVAINRFELATPTLNEIFLRLVGHAHE